jgi:DNA-binding helix-hairpin-helix protein with protein kinase domain
MCRFLGCQQEGKTELHHIAGRGRHHEQRWNYASLCSKHHAAIQSRYASECLCLVLKALYDREFYSPEVICQLRGRADTWITELDMLRATCIMEMVRLCR